MKRLFPVALVAVVAVIAAVYLFAGKSADQRKAQSQVKVAQADYVGAGQCAQCHQQQADDWRGSHHDLAMQHASDETILGDFGDSGFNYFGVESTFMLKDGKYIVRTDGPDGSLQDFEVKYAFGVEPLQQYLVELDGGRLQALHLAWDTRPEEQGGQRWFHLYPDQRIDHTDELHWTRLSQNWNYMCAECHSTNLKKNFDLAANRFDTTWSEIDVACEACHGPASNHLAWTKDGGARDVPNMGLEIVFDERRGAYWQFEGDSTIAMRNTPRTSVKEIETCARCHSRRSLLSEDYHHGKPFLDTHLPALLTDQLYHADGQIDDEVYVYGSFLQSKMFDKGVTCSDCHDPHSLQLRAPGNQVCLQCHQASAYDSQSHHFHPEGSVGSLCSECHMPPKNYMVIDPRHDHSFRVPRPDLSERLGTPNACNKCHADQTPAWASATLDQWYGENRKRDWHYGETLFAARHSLPNAGRELAALAASRKFPDIVRATAASALAGYQDPLTQTVLQPLLNDESARVRVAALESVEGIDAAQRWGMASPLLSDPVLAVRIEAARVLAGVDRATLAPVQAAALDAAIAEYVAAQKAAAEHPQSHINLGLLRVSLRDYQRAETDYRQALTLDPAYEAAYVNLSDLYRLQDDEEKAEQTLIEAQSALPGSAAVSHALGLHYVRAGQSTQAMSALARAVELAPDNLRYAYVYAVGLYDSGRESEAIDRLEQTHRAYPYDIDLLVALVSYTLATGDSRSALKYAEKLSQIEPRLGSAEQILERFSGAA